PGLLLGLACVLLIIAGLLLEDRRLSGRYIRCLQPAVAVAIRHVTLSRGGSRLEDPPPEPATHRHEECACDLYSKICHSNG
ncbi:MAG: hypothetical protein LC685_05510, partial [Actinobacteria bacterium]|nr:hypothetical protein [Actinomycetota bacterium]